ncbi:hypothetical protein J2S97_003876 [Arthrobacter oryzae]|nr:hypothetical protein [Arthrobacter oryzae]
MSTLRKRPRSAAQRWIGCDDKNAADAAAVDALRAYLSTIDIAGRIAIGEGEKDAAPMLYNGELVGTGRGPCVDIGVDPIDGTSLTAAGRPNALCVIAVSDRDTMLDASATFYMDKIVTDAEECQFEAKARHAAPFPHVHGTPEATSQRHSDPHHRWAGPPRNQAATRRSRSKFRSALLRRLFPRETLNRSRYPKLHSGPSNPAVTPLSERRTNLTDTSGAGPTKEGLTADAVKDRVKTTHRAEQARPLEQARTLWEGTPQREQIRPRHERP